MENQCGEGGLELDGQRQNLVWNRLRDALRYGEIRSGLVWEVACTAQLHTKLVTWRRLLRLPVSREVSGRIPGGSGN